MSWQAQIKGTKKWVLMTPPECYNICPYKMEIVVEPGDIGYFFTYLRIFKQIALKSYNKLIFSKLIILFDLVLMFI